MMPLINFLLSPSWGHALNDNVTNEVELDTLLSFVAVECPSFGSIIVVSLQTWSNKQIPLLETMSLSCNWRQTIQHC